ATRDDAEQLHGPVGRHVDNAAVWLGREVHADRGRGGAEGDGRRDGWLAVLRRRLEQRDVRGRRDQEPAPQSAVEPVPGHDAGDRAVPAGQRGVPGGAAAARRPQGGGGEGGRGQIRGDGGGGAEAAGRGDVFAR